MKHGATYPVLFIFDGCCGVCTGFARVLRNLDSFSRALDGRRRGNCVRTVPIQKPGIPESAGLSLENCRSSAWAVTFDGGIYRGAEAVNVAISGAIGARIPKALCKLPLIGELQKLAYDWITANRRKVPGGLPYCSHYPGKCRSN